MNYEANFIVLIVLYIFNNYRMQNISSFKSFLQNIFRDIISANTRDTIVKIFDLILTLTVIVFL